MNSQGTSNDSSEDPWFFDALDKDGEPVQGTIHGADENMITQQLEKDFGYKVSRIYRKASAENPGEETHNESIIFQSAPRIIHSKPLISEEELNAVHDSIQILLAEKGAGISHGTRDRLLHLDGMIDLIRENQDKRRWKSLRQDIRQAQNLAEREIRHYEDEKWKAYEEKNPVNKINSYTEFSAEKPKKTYHFFPNKSVSKLTNWLRKIDSPNEKLEDEVLLKQQYESVWTELQRFSGALLVFYVFFFFVSYYFKRNGVEDSLLLRIYDTPLFKQLILGLFLVYVFLTVRQEWLRKRLKNDASLILIFIVILSIFFW